MASFNRVTLVGNLCQDPETKYTAGGTAICDVSLAINDKRKDASGNWKESTTFVPVTLFGRTAEVLVEYARKGSCILVEGRLQMDQWQDRTTGEKRSKLKVVGETMQLLVGKQDRSEQATERNQAPATEPESAFAGDDVPF